MHALVLNGAILRVADFGVSAAPVLAPNKGAWLQCSAEVTAAWTHDGSAFLPPPPPPLAEAKAAKLAELAAMRYARETAGIGGFRTDRESQALLTGAALAATLDSEYTVDWKGESGWVTLNAAQLLAAAQAARAHVQACFSNERAHAEAIAALTTTEAVGAYDLSTGWP